MQHDLVQLVGAEESMTADGHVLRGDRLERALAQVAREDDVDDVLRGEAANRRDRVGDSDRPLDRHLVVDPHLLPQLAVEGVDEAFARVHPAAREEPVLAAALLVPAEQDAPLPAQDRGDPDARLHHGCEEPKPRTPRSLSGSSSTSASSSSGTGRTTSWAIRIPGSTTKGSRASVLRRTTRISPR